MKYSKYFFVFLLTLGIFAGAWQTSTILNDKKFANLKATQDQVSIDILSSETQFDLLQEDSCVESATSVFGRELASLAEKIAYTEQHVTTSVEINTLKKQYTLLQVRDFLLTKRVSERCKQVTTTIFYFYGTSADCLDCVRQGYVLDAIRSQYPSVRVYSFDYNLDLDTIKALVSIYKIGDTLPALVINGTTYQGYQTLEQLRALIPPPSKKGE